MATKLREGGLSGRATKEGLFFAASLIQNVVKEILEGTEDWFYL